MDSREVRSHEIVTDKGVNRMEAKSDLGTANIRCFVHTLGQRVEKVIIAQ